MLGLLSWLLLSALAAASGWAVALVWAPDRPQVERLLAGGVFSLAAVHSVLLGTGLLGILRPWPVGLLSLLLWGAPLGWAVAKKGSLLREKLRSDLATPLRLVREGIRNGELLLPWAWAVAGFAIVTSALISWKLPLWSWDCVWYHQAMTRYVLQDGRLSWVPTNVWYVNGYPKATELLAAWNCLFTHQSTWEDLTQFPHALLGALAVASFARRLSASPPMAAASGALWLLAPAVYLQIHTTHADIPAGMFFLAGFFFLTSKRLDAFSQLAAAVAFGMYAATKVTGLFHLALVMPLWLVRLGLEAFPSGDGRKSLGSALRMGLLSALLIAALGSYTFISNIAHTGNPFWPARVTLPVLGPLKGEIDPDAIAPMPAFLGAPGAATTLVGHWFAVDPSRLKTQWTELIPQLLSGGDPGIRDYFPDARWDPYGKLFTHLLLWVFLAFAVSSPFRQNRWAAMSLVLLAALSLSVPAAWWGRFTLAFWGAVCAAFAGFHQGVKFRIPKLLLSVAAAYLAVQTYTFRFSAYQVTPSLGASAAVQAADQVRLRAVAHWMFTPPEASLREKDLRPGETVSYDGHMGFLGELWTEDFRNRVEQVIHTGDDQAFLNALKVKHVRWAGVEKGTPGERLLSSRPSDFQPLFESPLTSTQLFRVSRSLWEQ